jgi:hypothetical protein
MMQTTQAAKDTDLYQLQGMLTPGYYRYRPAKICKGNNGKLVQTPQTAPGTDLHRSTTKVLSSENTAGHGRLNTLFSFISLTSKNSIKQSLTELFSPFPYKFLSTKKPLPPSHGAVTIYF